MLPDLKESMLNLQSNPSKIIENEGNREYEYELQEPINFKIEKRYKSSNKISYHQKVKQKAVKK